MTDGLDADLDEIQVRVAYVTGHLVAPEAMPKLGVTPRLQLSKVDVPRLLRAVHAVLALCRDAKGNDLPPEATVTVGECRAAISSALRPPPA